MADRDRTMSAAQLDRARRARRRSVSQRLPSPGYFTARNTTGNTMRGLLIVALLLVANGARGAPRGSQTTETAFSSCKWLEHNKAESLSKGLKSWRLSMKHGNKSSAKDIDPRTTDDCSRAEKLEISHCLTKPVAYMCVCVFLKLFQIYI